MESLAEVTISLLDDITCNVDELQLHEVRISYEGFHDNMGMKFYGRPYVPTSTFITICPISDICDENSVLFYAITINDTISLQPGDFVCSKDVLKESLIFICALGTLVKSSSLVDSKEVEHVHLIFLKDMGPSLFDSAFFENQQYLTKLDHISLSAGSIEKDVELHGEEQISRRALVVAAYVSL